MKILAAFTLLLSLAFGVFSCSDKVVTNTTYQDTFRVPIHNSGLNDSLAYDKVYFTLKDATTKEILFSDSAEAGFVSGTDPIFTYTSSERNNLILDYEVIANGVVILSLKDQNIYSSDASKTLPIPYIADDSIINTIRVAQNKVKSYFLLRADKKHAQCVQSFEPEAIDTVGTKIIAVKVTPAPAESCLFQGWEVEKTSAGSAILLDSIHFPSNRMQVYGATGFLTANFLFPNELPVLISSSPIASQPAHSSAGTSSTEDISSSSDALPGSSASKLSSVSAISSSNPPKIIVVSHPVQDLDFEATGNTPIEFQYSLPAGKSIASWNNIPGATVSWKPGNTSTWVITVDYSLLEIDATLSPVTIDIATELTMSTINTTPPARLYLNPFDDAYYTLSMKDYMTIGIDKLTVVDNQLKLQSTPATAALSVALDYNNPYFHNRISFGKTSYDSDIKIPLTYRKGPEVLKQSLSLSQTAEFFTIKDIATQTTAVDLFCSAIDAETNGTRVIVGCLDGSFPNASTSYHYSEITTTTDEEVGIQYTSPETETYLQTHDVAIYGNYGFAAIEYRVTDPAFPPVQSFSIIDLSKKSTRQDFTSNQGVLISVIPQLKANPGTFIVFGNRELTHPEIFVMSSAGSVTARHENKNAEGFEYTGGVELPDGRILAWGGPVGAWATGSNVLNGILAMYSKNMELIWERRINFQPFGAETLPNGSYLVAGFANTLVASEVLYQQIGLNGE